MHRLVTSLAIAGVLAACGGAATPRRPLGSHQSVDLGVVAVGARIGHQDVRSSGIVIDAAAGLVLTTAHTVWGARSLKLGTALGVLHGRIVARAPCDDLALIEAQPRIPGLVALPRAGSTPAPGQLLQSAGRRRADPDAGAYGLLSIPVRVSGAPGDGAIDPRLPLLHEAIPLDGPLVPEASGGPIVDRADRIVGMGIARTSGPGLSLTWTAIQRRLDQLRPGPREVYVGWRDQYRCVHQMHAYARRAYPGFRARDARLNAPVPATRLPGTQTLDG